MNRRKKNNSIYFILPVAILLAIAILSICIYKVIKIEPTESVAVKNEPHKSQTDKILETMTIEEKINQMFIITPEALTGIGNVVAAGDATRTALSKHPVGGLIYFAQNFEDEVQIREMLLNTKKYGKEICKVPLFIGIDEEGGTVARFGNSDTIEVEKIDNMSVIGAGGDKSKAYNVGVTIGCYLKDYGFNLDFAPVADVLTNSENQIVKERSFGSDPVAVSDMAIEVSRGLNEKGIISCFKHFPGHGATKGDTHEGFAFTDKTYEEIVKSELIPFIKAIENNQDMIMVGHISLPNVIGDNTPSSISDVMINDILKDRLGYKGVVITDALNMGALTNLYKSDEIAVRTVNAGVDILLMPEDFELAYTGVLNAVNDGTISEKRIDESVRKIIDLKLKINN